MARKDAGDEGCVLDVRVKPNARKDRIVRTEGRSVEVAVAAPAREGKANRRVCKVLAAFLAVPKSHCRIVRGEKSRNKGVRVAGLSSEQAGERLSRAAKDAGNSWKSGNH